MQASISFSGDCSHQNEVPAEKQLAHAQKVAAEIKEVFERNHIGGSGSVSIGQSSATFSASSTTTLD